jgi:hypothetical protein
LSEPFSACSAAQKASPKTMVVDGGRWWSMVVNGGRRWSMVVDGGRRWVVVD